MLWLLLLPRADRVKILFAALHFISRLAGALIAKHGERGVAVLDVARETDHPVGQLKRDAELVDGASLPRPRGQRRERRGLRYNNVETHLAIADGAFVGTAFKVDGKFENYVDPKEVEKLMNKVRAFRETL